VVPAAGGTMVRLFVLVGAVAFALYCLFFLLLAPVWP
jgi:hypothetical protein